MNEKVIELLNSQVNKEFYSAYLYLEMANYYVEQGLDGFSNWFKIQAQEERDHALLFMEYLQNNGEKVVLDLIAKPDRVYTTNEQPLAHSLEHEKFVTESINGIYDCAYGVKDFRTMQFLDWFIKEQGEEEKNSMDNIQKMELFGGDSKGLYMLNQEMGARIYSAPSLVL